MIVRLILVCCGIIALSKVSLSKPILTKKTLDRTHQVLSQNILTFSNSIDEYFSNTENTNIENKSRLLISFDTYFREAAGPYIIPNIDFRLVLPNTQDKLRLVLESDEQIGNSDTSREFTDPNSSDESLRKAGFKYIIEKSKIQFAATSGIIVNLPPDLFIRLTAKRNIKLGDWLLKIDEELRWVNNTGITSDTDINFDLQLSEKYLLRFVNNIFWNDNSYSVRFENGPSLFHKISNNKALAYHAHVVSINSPNFILTNYILRLSYRQNIYSDWTFIKITPFLNFPRENNFQRVPGMVVGIDALFGHI